MFLAVLSLVVLTVAMVAACAAPVAKSPSGEATTPQPTIYVSHTARVVSHVGEWQKAPPGKAYLLVSVRILNYGYEGFDTYSSQFAAIVGNIKYSPTYLLMDNQLETVELLNGGETTDVIAFEVSVAELEKHNYGYRLIYEPFLLEYNVVFQGTGSNS